MACHMIRSSPQNILIDTVALAVAIVVSSHKGYSHELDVEFGLSVGQERERRDAISAPEHAGRFIIYASVVGIQEARAPLRFLDGSSLHNSLIAL